MELLRRVPREVGSLGVLAGAFNPPTRAHLELAQAALRQIDEVLFVLPRAFPHKTYSGAGLQDRLRMVGAAIAHEARFSLGLSEGGLFAEIADECLETYPSKPRLLFLCGRDTAERIVGWDYGEAGAIQRMLDRFELLVADRGGAYQPPAHLAHRVHRLEVGSELAHISATAVRAAIMDGTEWRHWVPAAIVPLVREIYAGLR